MARWPSIRTAQPATSSDDARAIRVYQREQGDTVNAGLHHGMPMTAASYAPSTPESSSHALPRTISIICAECW